MSVYREELLLRSKDVDIFRRLRTSELFRLLQEASIRHTEQLGMGRDKTLDKGVGNNSSIPLLSEKTAFKISSVDAFFAR